MSLIHTISPHERGMLHSSLSPIINRSPRFNLMKNDPTSSEITKMASLSDEKKYETRDAKKDKADSNNFKDPFLAQYIKPSSFCCPLNSHELYFESINKQRKVKSFEIYQKYLKNRNQTLNYNQVKQPNFNQYKSKQDPTALIKNDEIIKKGIRISKPDEINSKTQENILISPVSASESITKALSKEFSECSINDLINLISRMLQSLISLNDKSVPVSISNPQLSTPTNSNQLLTRYHSRVPPSISVKTYLTRLTKFNNLSPVTLLTTIYYIDLLSHHYQPFFTLNSWTVHRFLLVGTTLSQKSMEDFFFTNDHYAKVGGVALSELNYLELDFLYRVDWKCVPAKQLGNGKSSIRYAKEVLDLYYSQLVQLMGNNITKDDRVVYIFSQEIFDSEDDDNYGDDIDENAESEVEAEIDYDSFDKTQVLQQKIEQHKYNSQGFSVDGSSSPHLKRRYYENQ